MWALIDLMQTIRNVDNELKRNTGLVMAFGFVSMSVVSALSIVIYSTNLDHSITFIRTMAAAVANICFGIAYYMLRRGII